MRAACRIAMGVVLACGWGSATLTAAEADGKALYDARCALCHGKGGVPTPGFAKKNAPDFTDSKWQKSQTDEQIAKAIADGVSGTMMRGFAKDLKPAEMAAVVKHIRSFDKASD